MVQLLFENFKIDKTVYHEAEAWWKAFFDELAQKHNFFYRPYLNTTYRNGVPFYDGNPMFTALVETLHRGVHVLQDEVEEASELYISGYLNRIVDFDDIPDSDELVIDLVLSEVTKAIAETWIHAWLVEQVDKETMERLLDEKMILVSE
jgi:hypothetical protein